jgi:hypothetical protein
VKMNKEERKVTIMSKDELKGSARRLKTKE